MFCRSCGTAVADGAVACTNCGKAPYNGYSFCQNCGAATNAQAIACTSCGAGLRSAASAPSSQGNNKIAAGLCGIFLGGLGVHKFILGYTGEGLAMLLISLLTGWITCFATVYIMMLIGLIEGIIYLTKSDEEFYQTYVVNKRGWF